MTLEKINDLSVRIVGNMVIAGIVKDCTDTDDETEFAAQDIIREELARHFKLDTDVLKCGDTVNWKGAWGKETTQDAVIRGIFINCVGNDGDSVPSCPWDDINDRSVIVDLTNGSWAYGNQITRK